MSDLLIDLQCGDTRERMREMADNSVDACVTDPPYGIGFMGREWDTFKPGVEAKRIVENKASESDNPNLKGRARGPASSPSAVEYDRTLAGQRAFQTWTESWARELFRVLKPGAHAVVFGAPRAHHRMMSGLEDAGFEIRDCLAWMFGQGFPKSSNQHGAWEGWGTALKPAFEPIALARKPFKGTLGANLEAWGVGALNIDGCRCAYTSDEDKASATPQGACTAKPGALAGGAQHDGERAAFARPEQKGRWPAGLILDEEAGALLDAQTGPRKAGGNVTGNEPSARSKHTYGDHERTPFTGHGDSGGPSRFFYCPKVSKAEREYGCDGNKHPTVKPVALMRWLVRLVTPPGGLVLDPFLGSGSTGIAATLEGFRFVGFDKEQEWLTVAYARIAAWRERDAA